MCLSLNNCCCCFTLNVGTKVIAVLGTLSTLVSFLVYGTSALLGSELPPGRLLFYSSMAVTAFVQCICGCALVYGAFARKPNFTVSWTAITWCQSVILMVLTVTGTVLLSYNRKLETTAEISAIISVYFVYALILFYFASVVNSRRQQMMIESRSETAKRLMRHRVLPTNY